MRLPCACSVRSSRAFKISIRLIHIRLTHHRVETGQAPNTILAVNSHRQKAGSQLLCPYPQYARYKGSGNPHHAANFACIAPQSTGESP
jgi:hypothetical protein